MPTPSNEPTDFHPWAPALAEHMWIAEWRLRQSSAWDQYFTIEGRLKPTGTDAREVRRGFIDTFEKIMDLLEELGAVHRSHPVIRIDATSTRQLDGSNDFAGLYCLVIFEVRAALPGAPPDPASDGSVRVKLSGGAFIQTSGAPLPADLIAELLKRSARSTMIV